MIIDVTLGFAGEGFATACPGASEAVSNISVLLKEFRDKGMPVVFTTGDARSEKFFGGATKRPRTEADLDPARDRVVEELKPLEGELVIKKNRASAFFGMPLAAYFYRYGIETLLVTGTSTSGCVRASVVDAFSYGFKVIVVEEAVFDRADTLHLANLFDMNAKYAEVVDMAEIFSLLENI